MSALQRNADTLFPSCNTQFVKDLLTTSNERTDGRNPFQGRPVTVDIAPDDCSVTVAFGKARFLASLRADLQEVRGASKDGRLVIDVKFSPMASTSFEPGERMGSRAALVSHLLQKLLADFAAVDLEALVIRKGRQAWTLYLDVTIINADGALQDGAVFAAVAALAAFRLPQAEVTQEGNIIIHSPEEREPLPLTIHHEPLCATFHFIGCPDTVLLDATREEAAAAVGSVVVVRDRFCVTTGELCAVHKSQGMGMSASQLHRCIRLAAPRAEELGGVLRAALKVHEDARVLRRVRRMSVGPSGAGGSMARAAARVEAMRQAVAPRAVAVVAAERGGATLMAQEAPAVTPLLRTLALSEAGAGGRSAPVKGASWGAGVAGEATANGAGVEGTAQLRARVVTGPSEAPEPGQGRAGKAEKEGRTVSSRERKRRLLKRDAGVGGCVPVETAPGYDEFESIAAMIAGPVTTGAESTLEGSVKKKKNKKPRK